MRRKIWLKVDELRLFLGCYEDRMRGGNQIVGALKVGECFTVDGIFFAKEENDRFSQNWAWANARVLDVPLCHQHGHQPKNLLRDFLIIGLMEQREQIKEFVLKSKIGDKLELPSFVPLTWEKPLRIPVEFIRLYHFNRPRNYETNEKLNYLTVHIQIGHHIVFWESKLVLGKRKNLNYFRYGDNFIQNKQIISIINKMLLPKNIQKHASWIFETCEMDPIMTTGFTKKLVVCNMEKIPLIRFY